MFFVVNNACHCVGLTRARLPIGKNRPVVALKDVSHDRIRGLLVNHALIRVVTVSQIKCELLGLFLGEWPLDPDLRTTLGHLDNLLVAFFIFLVVHGPATD